MNLQETVKSLESLRREAKTLSPDPVPTVEDYSTAGIAIEIAMSHLNEGIPNGQAQRCKLALQLLQHGAKAMGVWFYEIERRHHKVSVSHPPT